MKVSAVLRKILVGLSLSVPVLAFFFGTSETPTTVALGNPVDQSCPVPSSATALAKEDINLFVTCGGFFD